MSLQVHIPLIILILLIDRAVPFTQNQDALWYTLIFCFSMGQIITSLFSYVKSLNKGGSIEKGFQNPIREIDLSNPVPFSKIVLMMQYNQFPKCPLKHFYCR